MPCTTGRNGPTTGSSPGRTLKNGVATSSPAQARGPTRPPTWRARSSRLQETMSSAARAAMSSSRAKAAAISPTRVRATTPQRMATAPTHQLLRLPGRGRGLARQLQRRGRVARRLPAAVFIHAGRRAGISPWLAEEPEPLREHVVAQYAFAEAISPEGGRFCAPQRETNTPSLVERPGAP